MSALRPKADGCGAQLGMSALGQKRTSIQSADRPIIPAVPYDGAPHSERPQVLSHNSRPTKNCCNESLAAVLIRELQLVSAHKPAVTDDVAGKNGCQLPFGSRSHQDGTVNLPISKSAYVRRDGSVYPVDDVRFGSQADICSAKRHVRFTPESGHVQCTRPCPLWANNGLMRCSN